MLLRKIKRSVASTMILGTLAVATLGTGFAAAASGSSTVGGGQWSWSNIPGVCATSSYYHASLTHSASAQVGSGSVVKDMKGANQTARATAFGLGTTRVWWNTY